MAGDVFNQKQIARVELERRRRALTAAEVRLKGDEASRRLVALPFFEGTIAAYVAQPFELAVQLPPPLALPRLVKGSKVLAFHLWNGEPLVAGPLGLMQPTPDSPRVEKVDVFVVPGVGFALDGTRLGRGGGYYDATLKAMGGVRVGFTFDCCVVDVLPSEPWDVPVDWIVTESRTLKISRP
jgi:5-formyltetrahydrofolate cyclo-ligase